MKIIHLLLYFLFIPFFSFAQFTVKGTIEPFSTDIKWAILYQIKEGRQQYVKNSKIVNNQFSFEMQEALPSGMYRINFRLKGERFLDFIYNKEDVTFSFHPDYPDQIIEYSSSKENKMYQSYLQNIYRVQQYIDSLQVDYFRQPNPASEELYREAFYKLKGIQVEFESEAENMFAFHFIKATQRYNASKIVSQPQQYLENIKANFFKHINFNDSVLNQSSFLVDRVIDYVFNLNYSKDLKIQQNLHQESIAKVLNIPKATSLKKDLIEMIINEFVQYEDKEMITFLFENYYDKLPIEIQDENYKVETLAKVNVVIGALAPDFSLISGKKLSELNTHKNYIILFWSTSCSHCSTQLPKMYKELQGNTTIQVIAIALEEEDAKWKALLPNFKDWEHVLGVGRWKNTIARSYNIESTPTYFLLNANKRIIALPKSYKELNKAISLLKL